MVLVSWFGTDVVWAEAGRQRCDLSRSETAGFAESTGNRMPATEFTVP